MKSKKEGFLRLSFYAQNTSNYFKLKTLIIRQYAEDVVYDYEEYQDISRNSEVDTEDVANVKLHKMVAPEKASSNSNNIFMGERARYCFSCDNILI